MHIGQRERDARRPILLLARLPMSKPKSSILVEKKLARMALVKLLKGLWPGVVFSPLSHARRATIPAGALPGPRWVRVENHLAGICGSDLHFLLADADVGISAAALPGTDVIFLGHEVIGHVAEVGAGVTQLKVGDRVILDAEAPNCHNQEIDPPCRHCRDGNMLLCENTCEGRGEHGFGGGWGDGFTAHERGLYRVPDELSDEAAMMIEPLSVGVRAALRRLPRSGEQALVVGSGTIGLGTLAALRALAPECQVTVLARYPHQAALARRLGAHEVAAREDPYELTARVAHGKLYTGLLGNRNVLGGFDVVYDCVGSQQTVGGSLRWARAGGAVVLVGASFAPLRVDLTPVWHQEVDLLGLYAHGAENTGGAIRSTYDITRDLLLERRLPGEELITHRFPLARWQEAVRTALDKRSGAIKVVMECC